MIDRETFVMAIDPETIVEHAAANGERVFLHVVGPGGCSTEALVAVGRMAVDHHLTALETVTGIHDADFREYWRGLIVGAMVKRIAEVELWPMPSGVVQ